MHIKDSGTFLLTAAEYKEYIAGRVSVRIQEVWNLEYEQLNSIIKAGNYKVIDEDNGTETRTIKNSSTDITKAGEGQCSSVDRKDGEQD